MPSKNINEKNLNQRDIFGRDYSYLASCLPGLKNLASIDLYSHDLESGYSPLHITLLRGALHKSFKLYKHWKLEKEYFAHKLGGHVLDQKDRDGLTPIELYNIQLQNNLKTFPKYMSYLEDSPEVKWTKMVDYAETPPLTKLSLAPYIRDRDTLHLLTSRGGTHLLTVGKNTHYQLGTGTKTDRQNYFQLHIGQFSGSQFPPTNDTITDIRMTRYHSFFTTSSNKIYMCGSAAKGRLGNDSTETPLLRYTEVADLSSVGIRQIDTSEHHSILLSDAGDVYSWGWNAYSQLGYGTSGGVKGSAKNTREEKNMENQYSATLRRVPFCTNKHIRMVACSNVHTCVLTKENVLYLWGLNVGQMGHQNSSYTENTIDYMGYKGHIQSEPMSINLQPIEVKKMLCTEFATFVLFDDNTLQVFCDYKTRSFKLQLPKARNYKVVDSFGCFNPRAIPSKALDIKCSNPFGNNLCISYECGRIGIVYAKEESPDMWLKFSKFLPINLFWTPNYEINRCLDFDVGASGGLILCTIGGEVFKSMSAEGKFHKEYSSKLVTGRVFKVCCNSSFDSFGFIKDESMHIPIAYPRDSLLLYFSQYSPVEGVEGSYDFLMYGLLRNIESCPNKCLMGTESATRMREIDYEKPQMVGYQKELTHRVQEQSTANAAYDVEFVCEDGVSHSYFCHKLILKSRCQKLISVWEQGKEFSVRDGTLSLRLVSDFSSSLWKVRVTSALSDGFAEDVIKSLIHLLYTDEKPESQLSILLMDITDNIQHKSGLEMYLRRLLDICLGTVDNLTLDSNIEKPDVKITLADGEIFAHSLILSTRNLYFRIKCSVDEWATKTHDGYKHIRLEHIKLKGFVRILKHLYGVPYREILQDLSQLSNTSEILESLGELLQVCDELCSIPMKNYLEHVLVQYIDGATVIPLLSRASQCNAQLLSTACQFFICAHIGILFCKEYLELVDDSLTPQMWTSLESTFDLLLSRPRTKGNRVLWYENTSKDWMGTFLGNLGDFNKYFMSPADLFTPTFDLLPNNTSTKTSDQRKHSSDMRKKQDLLEAQEEDTHKISDSTQRKLSGGYWANSNRQINSESGVSGDNTEAFTLVTKKSKKKGTPRVEDKLTSGEGTTKSFAKPKVVIQKNMKKTTESLPSLLSQTDSVETKANSSSQAPASGSKIVGTFKKTSQRERRKKEGVSQSPEPHVTKPAEVKAWSKSGTTREAHTEENKQKKTIPHSERLPSLLSTDMSSIRDQKKRTRQKGTGKTPGEVRFTELVSTGTSGGIRPYMTTSVIPENEITSYFEKKATGEATLLEEQAAAKEFEEWFAKESARVQNELKSHKDHNIQNELQVVYESSQTMPKLLSDKEHGKAKKKVRAKFPSKRKIGSNTSLVP